MNPPKDSRNPAETRANLLTQARLVFAEHGFAGARVDDIAKRAGVNKALINYHFGSKARLFRAILDDFSEKFISRIGQAIQRQDPPDQQLSQFIRAMGSLIAEFPQLPKLLLIDGRKAFIEDLKPPAHALIVLAELNRILQEGHEQGLFKPLFAGWAYMHIVSSFAFFHLTLPTRKRHVGNGVPGINVPEYSFDFNEFVDFVEDQVLCGFRKPGEEDQP